MMLPSSLLRALCLTGKTLTKPAKLEIISPRDVRLTISEGRYHQVKRMFAAGTMFVLHRERVVKYGSMRLLSSENTVH